MAQRRDFGDRFLRGLRRVAVLIMEFVLIAFVVMVVFFTVKGLVSLAPGHSR
jgi:hypothetical protein